MNTIYPSTVAAAQSDDPDQQRFGRWATEIIWNRIFGGNMANRDHVLEVYDRHVRAVLDEAPTDRLLVFEAAQGGEPLRAFLDVPVAERPDPRTDTTEELRANGGVREVDD